MATTLTASKATPFSLAYTMAGDGAKGTYAGAAVIASCVPGPLRNLLVKLTAANQLNTLNLSGTRSLKVRIRHVEGSTTGQVSPATRLIEWTATGLEVTATNNSVSQIELRLAHSSER